MHAKNERRLSTNLGWFGVPPSGGSKGLDRLKPGLEVVRVSWSQCMRKRRKGALHEPQGAAGILPGDQSEQSTAGKMPGTRLAIHTPGTLRQAKLRQHGVSSVVARASRQASRPCESCNQQTGETPVPLPPENQRPGIQR